MKLREYQAKAIQDIRVAFQKSNRVFFVLPTGAGKTFIFSNIAKSAIEKGSKTWIVCPRNELIWQSVESLERLSSTPSIIAPGHKESDYPLHVVSKDTWIRRKDKIKNKPDFIIVDEGHLATDRYCDMIETYPDAKFLFVSATPERLNGQDLTQLAPESAVVYGPSIKWLMDNNYLSRMKYLCPPISGIENIKTRGTEYDREQLELWLAEKKIYSKTIDSYKKHALGKQSIVFCRDIEHSKHAANEFNAAGFHFESIDGTMARKSIKAVIEAVRHRELDGLTSCELVTYGLDVPNVKCIIMLRPTKSRALYYQMLGRGLRFTADGDDCVVLDQVGNAIRNCDGRLPWDQPDWNYSGKVKRNQEKGISIKYCPWNEFLPCIKPSCVGCKFNQNDNKPVDRWEEIDGELVPIIDSKKLSDRPKEERKYFDEKLDDILSRVGHWNKPVVSELLNHAKSIGRQPLWCYYITDGDNKLLHMISDIMGYKSGWVSHAMRITTSKKKRA